MLVFLVRCYLQLFIQQLTTIEPPLQQMGKVVAELIIEKIKEPLSPNRSIVLDAEIKLRASSKKEKK